MWDELESLSMQDELRDQRRSTADPRAARTRRAIIDAARELADSGHAMPSVSEIVRHAGISRSSFYTQFSGTEELTTAVLREALEHLLDDDTALRDSLGMTDLEATRISTTRLIAHFDEHREFYRRGLFSSASAYLEAERMVAGEYRAGRCLIAASTVGLTADIAATYLAAGTLALIRAWILGDLPGDAAQMTERLMALLPAWLGARPEERSDHPA